MTAGICDGTAHGRPLTIYMYPHGARAKMAAIPIGREGKTMNQPGTNLTTPILAPGPVLWFSAYRFGWGYCAFALKPEVVSEHLGAADETSKQLMLAFELGKRRILQTVEQKALPRSGERIRLTAIDLTPSDGLT